MVGFYWWKIRGPLVQWEGTGMEHLSCFLEKKPASVLTCDVKGMYGAGLVHSAEKVSVTSCSACPLLPLIGISIVHVQGSFISTQSAYKPNLLFRIHNKCHWSLEFLLAIWNKGVFYLWSFARPNKDHYKLSRQTHRHGFLFFVHLDSAIYQVSI